MSLLQEQSISHKPLSYASIDLAAIRHNFLALQRSASVQMVAGPQDRLELIPVIKADAYGHGMLEVARVIDESGGCFFGVSNVQEGIRLRQTGFKQKILVFETTLPEFAQALVEFDLIPSICTMDLAQELDRCARQAGRKVSAHLKVDTAMGRLGVPLNEAVAFVQQLQLLESVDWEGVFTHFPSADSDENLTLRQIKSFIDLLHDCERLGLRFKRVHAANSMGMMGYKNIFFNLARPGLMLYGLYPHANVRNDIHLKPAMSVMSKIIFLKTIARGSGVSYGHSFIAERDMNVAVLPIGYNDGYARALSNKAYVLIDGERCPLLGRVTMDQIIVDVSRVRSPQLGMPAVILGEDRHGNAVTADDLAAWSGTISYEIVCNLGNRLPRVYSS